MLLIRTLLYFLLYPSLTLSHKTKFYSVPLILQDLLAISSMTCL